MEILSALGLGLITGFIISTPILVFNSSISKKLDRMIKILEDHNSKYQQ